MSKILLFLPIFVIFAACQKEDNKTQTSDTPITIDGELADLEQSQVQEMAIQMGVKEPENIGINEFMRLTHQKASQQIAQIKKFESTCTDSLIATNQTHVDSKNFQENFFTRGIENNVREETLNQTLHLTNNLGCRLNLLSLLANKIEKKYLTPSAQTSSVNKSKVKLTLKQQHIIAAYNISGVLLNKAFQITIQIKSQKEVFNSLNPDEVRSQFIRILADRTATNQSLHDDFLRIFTLRCPELGYDFLVCGGDDRSLLETSIKLRDEALGIIVTLNQNNPIDDNLIEQTSQVIKSLRYNTDDIHLQTFDTRVTSPKGSVFRIIEAESLRLEELLADLNQHGIDVKQNTAIYRTVMNQIYLVVYEMKESEGVATNDIIGRWSRILAEAKANLEYLPSKNEISSLRPPQLPTNELVRWLKLQTELTSYLNTKHILAEMIVSSKNAHAQVIDHKKDLCEYVKTSKGKNIYTSELFLIGFIGEGKVSKEPDYIQAHEKTVDCYKNNSTHKDIKADIIAKGIREFHSNQIEKLIQDLSELKQ